MTYTSKLQNNIRNGFLVLDYPTKVLSFMFRTLLVLKLFKCPLQMAAILDLSNMAATEGAHLGSLEKLVGDGYISPWSKSGACGPILTII